MNAAFNIVKLVRLAPIYILIVLEFVYNISENKKIVHLGPTLGNSKHEYANPLN